jgi:hypothetical protein
VINVSNAAPTATATVQLSTPPGRYRPGGTSDYSAAASQHIEVAALPATAEPATSAAARSPAPTSSTSGGSGAIGTY